MAKKIILSALCAFFCLVSAKAQSVNDRAFHLENGYNLNETIPIVRYHQGYNLMVSTYEKSFRSIFVLADNNQARHIIELPSKHYVYDFEILGNMLYFCGEKVNSSAHSCPIYGTLDLQAFWINPSNVVMTIDTIPFPRDESRLNKMVVYNYNGSLVIMAIGHGEDMNNSSTNTNGIDFLFKYEVNFGNLDLALLPGERYYDIIETSGFVALIGIKVNNINSVGFRKIDKANPNSVVRDYFYSCDFPHPEPLTYIVGECLQSADKIVTATFASIGGIDGTVIRKYDIGRMDMFDSHFIPSHSWGKTQPHELKHIYNTEKLLMVQSSTAGIETLIFHLDINHSEDYSTIYEYYQDWYFYSLDRFNYPGYIATGHSANYPVYLINDVNNLGTCSSQVPITIESTDDYDLHGVHLPITFNQITLGAIPAPSSSAIVNFNIDCP